MKNSPDSSIEALRATTSLRAPVWEAIVTFLPSAPSLTKDRVTSAASFPLAVARRKALPSKVSSLYVSRKSQCEISPETFPPDAAIPRQSSLG